MSRDEWSEIMHNQIDVEGEKLILRLDIFSNNFRRTFFELPKNQQQLKLER